MADKAEENPARGLTSSPISLFAICYSPSPFLPAFRVRQNGRQMNFVPALGTNAGQVAGQVIAAAGAESARSG